MDVIVNLAVLCLLVANGWITVRKPEKGVAFYLFLALVCPHFRIEGMAIEYEILALIPIVLLTLYRKKFRIRWRLEYTMLFAYAVAVTLSSLLSIVWYGGVFYWLPLFGLCRTILLFVVVSLFVGRGLLHKVLTAALLLNFIAALTQLFIPETFEFYYGLYAKETHTVLHRYMQEFSRLPRAVGTLGSPVNLGAFALITFAVAYARLLETGYRSSTFFVLVIATTTGLLALSKTAIVGIPLIIAIGGVIKTAQWLIKSRAVSAKRVALAMLVVLVSMSTVWGTATLLNETGFNVAYYASFLESPLLALETRYSDDGSVSNMLEVAKEHWVLGVGVTRVQGEFVGDSTYVRVLHDLGVVGLILVLALYLCMLQRSLKRREFFLLLPIAALAVTGIALPTLFTLMGVIVYSYVAGDNSMTKSTIRAH